MSAEDARDTEHSGAARLSDLVLLPRRVYRFRMLGMGLGMVPIALVLRELAAPAWTWGWLVATCLVWPQLAYWLAKRHASPFDAELRNLMIDSVIAGLWAPLMHFNALPSALLVTVATADKINTGIRGLWLRSLPGMALAVLIGGLLTGFAFAPATSLAVVLACLPIMIVHTLAVSLASYQLVRKVQAQNRRLDELSRTDVLTGLHNRRYWQDQAQELLQRRHRDGLPATLMYVDVDLFKQINDQYGHGAGDDVLRGIAALLRLGAGPGAHVGRLGGDEFALALPLPAHAAELVAEQLRRGVEEFRVPGQPALRCSISLGLAQAEAAHLGLREWSEAADRALYRAKQGGRNRLVWQSGSLEPDPA